ncbi:hypothetical protein TcYC6_0050880 [Trypanosoma cruzi]|nr:hypothetical protein TcYC6_0050880 [Trypanosoma cruzi]
MQLHAQRQTFRQSEAGGVPPQRPQTGAGILFHISIQKQHAADVAADGTASLAPKHHGAVRYSNNTRLARALVDAVGAAPAIIPLGKIAGSFPLWQYGVRERGATVKQPALPCAQLLLAFTATGLIPKILNGKA